MGVLGGMGPAAGLSFCSRLVDLTPATIDQEHLKFILWSDPTVPDRTAALLRDGPSVVPAIERGIRHLRDAGADFLVVPCNTAHVWAPDIARAVGIELLSIIETTVAETASLIPNRGTVAVLGTDATAASRVYQEALERSGLRTLNTTKQQQREIMRAIYAVKAGGSDELQEATSLIQAVGTDLTVRGADAIISGCTEITFLRDQLAFSIPLIDSVEVLAKQTVAHSLSRGDSSAK